MTLPPTAGPDGDSGTCRRSSRRTRAADRLRREHRVAEFLAKGKPAVWIQRRTMVDFGVSERTARADIARVLARWAKELEAEEPTRRARLLGVLDTVMAGAIADHAWGAAVSAAREISRVCGFEKAAVIHLQTGGVTPADQEILRALRFTPPERAAEALRLERELASLAPEEGDS